MGNMNKDIFQFYRCRLCGTRMGFYDGFAPTRNSRFVKTRRFKSEDMSLVDDFTNPATPGGTTYADVRVFCLFCNSEMLYLDNEKVLDELDKEPWNQFLPKED